MCKYMYDCSYILRANMKHEAVNGCKCYGVKRCNIVVTEENPEFVECFKPEWSQLLATCKTKSVTHGFDLNSTEGTSQS